MSLRADIVGVAFLLLLFNSIVGSFSRSTTGKRDEMRCEWNGAGYCEVLEKCTILKSPVVARLLDIRKVPTCRFNGATSTELICCPYDDPTVTRVLPRKEVNFKHLANLGYINDNGYDSFKYRCTAIILSSTQLLATALCVGNTTEKNPTKVVLGEGNTEEYIDPELQFRLKSKHQSYKGDLVLLTIDTPIDFRKTKGASQATLCQEDELKGQPKLYAVGFGQNLESNCGLFKSRVERVSDCSSMPATRPVFDVNFVTSHVCVKDMSPSPTLEDSCAHCLTASTSVLHVERSDGSFCVAGIATPTISACVTDDIPIPFTSILTEGVQVFLGRGDKIKGGSL